MTPRNFFKLIACIVLCEVAGLIGTIFTSDVIPTWYAGLVKPPLNPPSWIFGPVWTMLYILMGVSLYSIWQKGIQKLQVVKAVSVFVLQLALNTAWSIVFFGMKDIFLALITIVLLWVSIVVTMRLFAKISKFALYLLIPYIAWVSFAAYLNTAIWFLN